MYSGEHILRTYSFAQMDGTTRFEERGEVILRINKAFMQ